MGSAPVTAQSNIDRSKTTSTTPIKTITATMDGIVSRIKKLQKERLDVRSSKSLLEWIKEVEYTLTKTQAVGNENDNLVEQNQSEGLQKWQKVQQLRKEKEVLLNSLSEVAGNRIKDNNPGIADLSDPNRPSKLAERYSELYDNEWTDLMEELRKDYHPKKKDEAMTEEDCITFICDTLAIVYKWCEETVTKQQKQSTDVMLMIDPASEQHETHQDPDIVKRCKDFHKLQTGKTESLKQIKKSIQSNVKECMSEGKKYPSELLKKMDSNSFGVYVDICAELCWFMRTQDPPIHMVLEETEHNSNPESLFRPYTRSGENFDFMVWPALKLHKDGSLLYKGIAQFSKLNF